MNKITVYTDGGCRGNGKDTNIGAYAYITLDSNDNILHEEAIAFKDTTNNQMELLAVISALESLSIASVVTIHSDSKYVCDAINNGWIDNWLKNGWKTAKKEPVKNQDLWLRLIQMTKLHHVNMKWVKGHNGNALNERCDSILNTAMDNFVPSNDSALDIDLTIPNDVELDVAILKRLIAMRDELNDLISIVSAR